MTSANPPVSTEAVNRHLEKLLQSSAMAKSWSLSRLLKFLVARALDGTAGELKEHTLGVEVFDRGPDFDPRTDNIVRVQVRNLRARLVDYYAGDGQHEPIRIDLPKGAYIVEFKQILETESAAALPAPRWWAAVKNKIWLVTAAAAVGLIVVAAVVFWELRHTRPTEVAPQNHVIAVLPFTDLDRNPGTEYFTDGLTEELINSLTQLDGLSVIARYSSFQFRGSNPNLQSVAEQLKATEVVEGSVRRQGSGIRVSVRLVSVPSGKTIWSREYDRVLKDAVRTEEDIANGVSAALRLKLSTAPRKAAAPNEEAHDLYLKGRYYWDKVDPLYSKKAMEFFTQAIAIDPNYSAPYVGLAGAYGTQAVWHAEPPRQKWPKMKEMLARALELDETNAEAHTLMAGVAAWYEWDYGRSETEYRKGVQLGPASLIAHQYFASMLGAVGRFAEADAEMERSLALDPLNHFARWAKAQVKYWEGDTASAKTILMNLYRENPDRLHLYTILVPLLSMMGEHDQAIRIGLEYVQRAPGDPTAIGHLGEAYGRAGRADDARRMLTQLDGFVGSRYVASSNYAFIYLGLGDGKRAFEYIVKAMDERAMRPPWILVDPRFKTLRLQPGFEALLARLHLPYRP